MRRTLPVSLDHVRAQQPSRGTDCPAARTHFLFFGRGGVGGVGCVSFAPAGFGGQNCRWHIGQVITMICKLDDTAPRMGWKLPTERQFTNGPRGKRHCCVHWDTQWAAYLRTVRQCFAAFPITRFWRWGDGVSRKASPNAVVALMRD